MNGPQASAPCSSLPSQGHLGGPAALWTTCSNALHWYAPSHRPKARSPAAAASGPPVVEQSGVGGRVLLVVCLAVDAAPGQQVRVVVGACAGGRRGPLKLSWQVKMRAWPQLAGQTATARQGWAGLVTHSRSRQGPGGRVNWRARGCPRCCWQRDMRRARSGASGFSPSAVWLYTTSTITSMPAACNVFTICLNSWAAASGPAPSAAQAQRQMWVGQATRATWVLPAGDAGQMRFLPAWWQAAPEVETQARRVGMARATPRQ